MPANLSAWIPELETARRLGISWRTLLRRAEAGEIERRMRPRAGKKPEPVYNPRDVERLEAPAAMVMRDQRLPANPSRPVNDSAIAPVFVAVLDRLAGALEKFAPVAPPAPLPTWMTPKEAGAYLGLSEALIRRLIRCAKLPCLRDKRGYIVARVHLDNLDSVAALAGLQAATADLRQVVEARRAAQ